MHARNSFSSWIMIRAMSTSWFAPSYSLFFQAEDGIRDDLVTGVQTCALPISCAQRLGRAAVIARFPGPVRRRVVQAQEEGRIALGHAVDEVHAALRQQVGQVALVMVFLLAHPQRSEGVV